MIGFVIVSLLLFGAGFILSFSKKTSIKETNPRLGLWKMTHMKLSDGYEMDYHDQDYSDTYYYFTKEKGIIFRLSEEKVILKQERFYRIQDGELLMSKTKDFKNPREYEFTSGVQKRMISFSKGTMQIIEEQENNTVTETYQKVDETLVKQLKDQYDQYLKELQKEVPKEN